jgi:predicted HTH transcriptional regulator
MPLTDEDILARLVAVEDGTVERKPYADSRVKTVVAFSNSLASDQPGVLFVGVNDNGTIQDQQKNLEELQKIISGELSNIYPPVYPTILVREKGGKKFVAFIVYGSAEQPHFAGKSYIRDGTQTRDASEGNIQEFIAKRSSKVAEIPKWVGKEITVAWLEHMMATKSEYRNQL